MIGPTVHGILVIVLKCSFAYHILKLSEFSIIARSCKVSAPTGSTDSDTSVYNFWVGLACSFPHKDKSFCEESACLKRCKNPAKIDSRRPQLCLTTQTCECKDPLYFKAHPYVSKNSIPHWWLLLCQGLGSFSALPRVFNIIPTDHQPHQGNQQIQCLVFRVSWEICAIMALLHEQKSSNVALKERNFIDFWIQSSLAL